MSTNSQLLSYGAVYQEGEDLPVLLEMDVKQDKKEDFQFMSVS